MNPEDPQQPGSDENLPQNKRGKSKRRPSGKAKPVGKKAPESVEKLERVPESSHPLPDFGDHADNVMGETVEPATSPAIPEGDAVRENPKKNRRRRKKSRSAGGDEEAPNSPQSVEKDHKPAIQIKPSLDRESVAKLAWKIYLAEVSEEGVALIGDGDARELSRRCFRLAEIFMEEKTRRN